MAVSAAAEVATTRWTTCLAAWEEVVRLAGSAAGVTRTAGLAEAGREGTRTGSEAVKPLEREILIAGDWDGGRDQGRGKRKEEARRCVQQFLRLSRSFSILGKTLPHSAP